MGYPFILARLRAKESEGTASALGGPACRAAHACVVHLPSDRRDGTSSFRSSRLNPFTDPGDVHIVDDALEFRRPNPQRPLEGRALGTLLRIVGYHPHGSTEVIDIQLAVQSIYSASLGVRYRAIRRGSVPFVFCSCLLCEISANRDARTFIHINIVHRSEIQHPPVSIVNLKLCTTSSGIKA